MNKKDRQPGMNVAISWRDFLNGVSVATCASLLASSSVAQDIGARDLAGYYPSELSGMRGSHPGSFTVPHMARDGATWRAMTESAIEEAYRAVGDLSNQGTVALSRQ